VDLRVFALATAVLLSVMLFAHVRSRLLLYGLTKTAASAIFVVAGALSLDLSRVSHLALFVGLVLSLLGDVLLVPKGHRLTFLMGLSAFLSAHVAYCFAFILHGVVTSWTGGAALAAALAGVPVALWLRPHVKGSMRAPVAAYVVTITAMVTLAAGATGAGAHPILLVGAVLFYLSDILVARERFVAKDKRNGLVGLPLYYAGQLLLIAGLSISAP
jgi:uncharacterized membrane protein YhhN